MRIALLEHRAACKHEQVIIVANAHDMLSHQKFLEFERIVFSECAGDYSFICKDESKDYRRFRKYVLFFTQLDDATTAEQVESLLVDITLPPVSYGIKRETGDKHLVISAYLGLGGGAAVSTEVSNQIDGYYVSLIAPIGFEWSKGCETISWIPWCKKGRSFNVMLAPFDFALPVNLAIGGEDDSVEFRGVVAPGFYLSWGMRSNPVNVGFGMQQGRALRSDNELENRYFLFVSFEMPLMMLH